MIYGRMCFKSVKTPELYILSCGKGALDLGRALPKKNMCCFSAQRAHQIVAECRKKQSISGDKKHIPKKIKFISKDEKYFSSYVFFACFFFVFLK